MRNTNGHGSAVLEQMLEPISRSFGVETARAPTEFRVEKCNEGKLTPAERAEYEAYAQASTLIGILQAKARKALANAKAV